MAKSEGNYQQLRNISLQGGELAVEKIAFKRDAASFQLDSGMLCFLPAVNNKVTGAVFIGDGRLLIDPPLAAERASLSLLTKEKEYKEF